MPESLARRTYDYLSNAYLSMGVCALMALSNAIDRSGMLVDADDHLSKQAALALPSALPTPVTTGNLPVDIGIQVAETAITIRIARGTSTTKQLIGSALTAQVISCAADAAVERTGWLTTFEKAQPDVGFSAINAAWLSKFFLDRADRGQTPLRKGLWRSAAVVYGGTITTGYYFLNGANGGKLELVSHGSGVAVGIAAHFLGRRNINSTQQSANTLQTKPVSDRVKV